MCLFSTENCLESDQNLLRTPASASVVERRHMGREAVHSPLLAARCAGRSSTVLIGAL